MMGLFVSTEGVLLLILNRILDVTGSYPSCIWRAFRDPDQVFDRPFTF